MPNEIHPSSLKWNVLTIPRNNGDGLRTADGHCVLVKDLEKLGFTVKHTGEDDYTDSPRHPWPASDAKS